ncbi:response regulator [Novosphingobium profundi]|uniref:response regulator transcription factor n=1 Tax=Novosphingobium profundi TaxID=1774954 RepID=UPI001BD99A60|nr:response regulator [Novosphingobium profundi]MBT0669350.1 response regulator [Novosphingobium profundi]
MARIVMAEDDPIVGSIVTRCLEAVDHRVLWLRDGDEALESIRQTLPHLVILDEQMPRMCGHEVLAQMRGDPELAGIPVLVLMASIHPGNEILAYRSGASDFMTKPFACEELQRRVEALLAAQPAVPGGIVAP